MKTSQSQGEPHKFSVMPRSRYIHLVIIQTSPRSARNIQEALVYVTDQSPPHQQTNPTPNFERALCFLLNSVGVAAVGLSILFDVVLIAAWLSCIVSQRYRPLISFWSCANVSGPLGQLTVLVSTVVARVENVRSRKQKSNQLLRSQSPQSKEQRSAWWWKETNNAIIQTSQKMIRNWTNFVRGYFGCVSRAEHQQFIELPSA